MVTPDFSATKSQQSTFVSFPPPHIWDVFFVCRCSPQTPLPARRPFRPASILRARRGLVSRMTSSWWTLYVVPALLQISCHLTLKVIRSRSFGSVAKCPPLCLASGLL